MPRCCLSGAVALPGCTMAAGARAVRKYAVAAAEEEASADQADEVERHARDGSWGTRAELKPLLGYLLF